MKRPISLVLVLFMLFSLMPAAFAAEGEPVTISFQTWNPGDSDLIHQIIDAFEAENPDIIVDYIYMPYSDHIADMQIKMASGEGPDVYGMQAGVTYSTFRPFEENLTPYILDTYGEGWESSFLTFCTNLLNEDGAYYGLPLGLTYAGLIWADMSYFSKYGLTLPASYDELAQVAQALRGNGEYPLAIGAKDDWINIDMWMNIAGDINAGKLYQALAGEISFTDPELLQSFAIWQSLFTNGIVQDGALGVNMYTDTTDLFEKEASIPMITNGSWAAGLFVSTEESTKANFQGEGADHQAFLMDWNNDGVSAGLAASIDVVLCMNTNSKHKDAAWKFIDFMVHHGQDVLINEGLQYFPSRTDLVLDVVGLNANGLENLEFIIENAQNNTRGYREMGNADVKQAVADALKALATNEMTPEEAAQSIDDAQ